MSSWKTDILQNLPIDFIDGDRSSKYPKRKEFVSEGIPFINADSISAGYLDLNKSNFITEEKFATIKKGRLQDRDIIFTTRGNGVGKTAYFYNVHSTGLINAQLLIVRANISFIDSRFLYYLFKSQYFQATLRNYVSGSAQPQIPIQDLRKIKVSYPPLSIQNKIASILSAYDDLIENNTRRIKILETMAQTIYQEWFVKFRFPGHEQVIMFESDLGLIPEGWEVKELSDVCVRITDGSHWSPKSVDDGYPMASVKDMHAWGLKIESCRKISPEDYEKLVRNDCKPLKNDILVAKDGSYLKHIFVTDKETDLVILSSIALLRPNDKILPHILSLYLLQPSIKSRMANYVSGAALPRIILKSFRKFQVLVPPINLQKKFYKIAEPMIADCYCLISKNDNLRKTRDLLLPKLISGQIDVENLDIDTGELAA